MVNDPSIHLTRAATGQQQRQWVGCRLSFVQSGIRDTDEIPFLMSLIFRRFRAAVRHKAPSVDCRGDWHFSSVKIERLAWRTAPLGLYPSFEKGTQLPRGSKRSQLSKYVGSSNKSHFQEQGRNALNFQHAGIERAAQGLSKQLVMK